VSIATDVLSGIELAAVFTEVTGSPVEYVQVPWEQWGAGRPAWLVNVYHWYEENGAMVDVASLREQYPGLRTFRNYLKGSGWGELNKPVRHAVRIGGPATSVNEDSVPERVTQ